MVRSPLTPQQIAAGKRLGAHLREARGDRTLVEIAEAASISPETLRKIETGRLATPAFITVAALAAVLEVPLDDLARICAPRLDAPISVMASSGVDEWGVEPLAAPPGPAG